MLSFMMDVNTGVSLSGTTKWLCARQLAITAKKAKNCMKNGQIAQQLPGSRSAPGLAVSAPQTNLAAAKFDGGEPASVIYKSLARLRSGKFMLCRLHHE